MSLANGRPYLAIPGPSVMPDRVLQAMHAPAPNIYRGALHELTASLMPDLKRVARTTGDVAIYICNGHGSWEAALNNVLIPGDKVLCLCTGRFGHGWGEIATRLGVDVEIMDFGQSADADMGAVEERLKADTGHEIRAVMSVFVDTSTSVKTDMPGLRAALDGAGHPALLMADCIASLACDRFEMDDWGVDIAVTGSQKGLMTPPGLGFVFFSPKAAAARERANPSAYWDWKPRVAPEIYYQYFCGTAPTHHLLGLRVALDMLHEEGIEAVWQRHERLAGALWAAVDRWGADGPLALNVVEPASRSWAVTSFCLPGGKGGALQDWCEAEMGVTLGIGLGREPAEDYFRIGHMGHVNGHMVLGVLGVIDAGLKALDVPHGAGALEAASLALSAP